MACFSMSRKQKLITTIAISMVFFILEISAGLYTGSLALVADAFHYLSDLLGFVVALVALIMSERPGPAPSAYTFGWQRTTLLGAFFNGVFLFALGISIMVQAIERFVKPSHVQDPKTVLIVGCIGLGLNLLVLSFLHDHGDEDGHSHGHSHSHSHSHAEKHSHTHSHAHSEEDSDVTSNDPHFEEGRELPPTHKHFSHKHTLSRKLKAGRDLGMMGVIIHVIGDAINNVGVIVSALVIWKAEGDARFYMDPAIGVFISIMIFCTAIPLTKRSGDILLQIAPEGIDVADVRDDLEKIPGVQSVHELHIWKLNQQKAIASAHVVIDSATVEQFQDTAKTIMECLHAYGVHSATLQPEVDHSLSDGMSPVSPVETVASDGLTFRRKRSQCQLECGTLCVTKRCCPSVDVSSDSDSTRSG